MTDRGKYFYTDHMWYDDAKYRPEVQFHDDGYFRWEYKMDKYHDQQMYKKLFMIFAIISIGGFIGGFLMASIPMGVLRQHPHSYQTLMLKYQLLYGIAGYAMVFALFAAIVGLVRLIEGGPSTFWYQLNEDIIQIKPSGRGSGVNYLEDVKRVELYPEVNEIRLISRWGKVQVMVRAEDYKWIKEFILAHVPAGTPSSAGRSQQ